MIHPKMKYVYVGVDSHKDSHCAVVLNCFFEKLGEVSFGNTKSDFESFLDKVNKLKLKYTKLVFGLEDISVYGRSLAVFLIRKNLLVKHVNSTLVSNERKTQGVLQKSDSIDGECASRVLISKFDSIPIANPQDKYWILKNLVSRRRNIIDANTGVKNELQSYILANYPNYDKFFSNIDCKSSLAFYEKYPSPSYLKNVSVEELKIFITDIAGKTFESKAKTILSIVKSDGNTSYKYQDIKDSIIKTTIQQLRRSHEDLDSLNCIIEGFLPKFGYKLQSLTGVDYVTEAELIAEIGDIKRFKTSSSLAKFSGIAPVTYASGKTDIQYSNSRGNRSLHTIFHRISLNLISASSRKKIINPKFYHYYYKKISEGKTKKQALKCIQRKLVTLVWKMMSTKTAYVSPPQEDYVEENKKEVN